MLFALFGDQVQCLGFTLGVLSRHKYERLPIIKIAPYQGQIGVKVGVYS